MSNHKQPCGCVVTTDKRGRQTLVCCPPHEAEWQTRHEAARSSGSDAHRSKEKTDGTP